MDHVNHHSSYRLRWRDHVPGKFHVLGLFLVMLVLWTMSDAEIVSPTLYLERGQEGVVPCPVFEGQGLSPGDIENAYWYIGSIEGTPPIVAKVRSEVFQPSDGYSFNANLSLVISQALDSSNGTYMYYCRFAPNVGQFQDGRVPVEVIVTPRTKYPVLSPSYLDSEPSSCSGQVWVLSDQASINLTCSMEYAKPAVILTLKRAAQNDDFRAITLSEQRVDSHENIFFNSSELQINNTFTTTVSVLADLEFGKNFFTCTGYGKAFGNIQRPSSQIIIERDFPEGEMPTTFSKTTTPANVPQTTVEPTSVELSTMHTTLENELKNLEHAFTILAVFMGFAMCVIVVLIVIIVWLWNKAKNTRTSGAGFRQVRQDESVGVPENQEADQVEMNGIVTNGAGTTDI